MQRRLLDETFMMQAARGGIGGLSAPPIRRYFPTTRMQNEPSCIVFTGFAQGSLAGVFVTLAAGRKTCPVFLSKAIVFALA
jgi:hypothetical protein